MTEDTKTRKSGRTAEQQAEREARKAAKKAAKGAKEAGTEAVAEVATDAADNTTEGAPEASTSTSTSRKRRAQDEDDADLLEIDLSAHAPMSKADLRAAKKRAKSGLPPLPPKTSAGEGSDAIEGEDKGEGAPRSRDSKPKEKPQAKGEFSIWIGNLSFRTAAEGLREFLVQGITEMGGEVDCITRVHMPKKGDKGSFAQNKGFAYVDFNTDAQRQLALGLSERPLDGRRVLIKAGDDHKANPDARTPKALPSGPGTMGPQVLAKQKHAESSTLFIGNLPFDVTEEELRDLVEGNADAAAAVPTGAEDDEGEGAEDEDEGEDEGEGEGEGEGETKQQGSSRRGVNSGLIKTRLAQFEDTGRCKGFAFWDFKTPAHAKAALMNRHNHTLRGRRLNLQFASEEATKRSGAAKKKAREAEEREGMRKPRHAGGFGAGAGAGGRPPKRPRYFEENEGGEEGGYEARTAGNAGPADYASEKGAAARIAAMVSGGGEDAPAPERRSGPKPKWEQAGRPRPGAALAMAKREKVGIVASEGNKITFD